MEKTDMKNSSTPGEHTEQVKREISWPSVLFFIHLNLLGVYGLIVLFKSTGLLTIVFTFALICLGVLGATAGAHRLWAHQTYKAEASLRVFLMLCQTITGQGSIYNWVQSHRLHHKTFRKDTDPFYSTQNFMAGHVQAQLLSYTPEQQRLLQAIDMSDLEADKVVMFQKKYYWIMYIVLHILLPINTPLEYWGETMSASIFVAFSLRYFIVLNMCWLINSSHFVWGLTKNFKPSDSNSVFFITKSYWPQYHYLLPQDYQTGEFGDYSLNFIAKMIRVFVALDVASDLKTISSTAVRSGLTLAVENGRDIVECIVEENEREANAVPKNVFVNRDKFL